MSQNPNENQVLIDGLYFTPEQAKHYHEILSKQSQKRDLLRSSELTVGNSLFGKKQGEP